MMNYSEQKALETTVRGLQWKNLELQKKVKQMDHDLQFLCGQYNEIAGWCFELQDSVDELTTREVTTWKCRCGYTNWSFMKNCTSCSSTQADAWDPHDHCYGPLL